MEGMPKLSEEHMLQQQQHMLNVVKRQVDHMYQVNQETQRQLKNDMISIGEWKDLMKWGVESGNLGFGRFASVCFICACQGIGLLGKDDVNGQMKEMLDLYDELKQVFDLDFMKELMINLQELLKKNVKIIEEVSPVIIDILEKVDIPSRLLEMGIERVYELASMEQGVSLEGLPVTLMMQVRT